MLAQLIVASEQLPERLDELLAAHDRVELEGPVGTLRGDLLHHAYRDLQDHLDTIDK